MIRMKTDAIHREDYPAMLKYTFASAASSDVVCGMSLSPELIPYYKDQLELKIQSEYYESCEEFSKLKHARKANRIWLMGYIDKDESVNDRNLLRFKERFKESGFNKMERVARFGGENGLNAVYLFEK